VQAHEHDFDISGCFLLCLFLPPTFCVSGTVAHTGICSEPSTFSPCDSTRGCSLVAEAGTQLKWLTYFEVYSMNTIVIIIIIIIIIIAGEEYPFSTDQLILVLYVSKE
jgi:hypothetical protein